MDVRPKRFQPEEVLFDDGEYSVAWGVWDGTSKALGERWNGQGEDPGYPRLAKHPTWFVVSAPLTVARVIGLLGQAGADKGALLRVLSELHSTGKLK